MEIGYKSNVLNLINKSKIYIKVLKCGLFQAEIINKRNFSRKPLTQIVEKYKFDFLQLFQKKHLNDE